MCELNSDLTDVLNQASSLTDPFKISWCWNLVSWQPTFGYLRCKRSACRFASGFRVGTQPMRLDSVTATARFGLKRLSSGLFGSPSAGRLTVVFNRRVELCVLMIASLQSCVHRGGGVV